MSLSVASWHVDSQVTCTCPFSPPSPPPIIRRLFVRLNTPPEDVLTPTEPVLFLGGLLCTAEEAAANRATCSGAQPTTIKRTAKVSLSDYQVHLCCCQVCL